MPFQFEASGGVVLPQEVVARHTLYAEFVRLLESNDRAEAIRYALSKLESGEIDIVTLYSELLAPSLNDMVCHEDEDTCIWKEHVRSSLVRAIIESCYPHVLREAMAGRKDLGGERVLVVCPTEEYHELGARMVADFFTLAGYEVTFIGANTPRRVILSATRHVRPKYLAMSVTNYYNLFDARQVIDAVREELGADVKIIVGGSAFLRNEDAASEVGADIELHTFDDILSLSKGG